MLFQIFFYHNDLLIWINKIPLISNMSRVEKGIMTLNWKFFKILKTRELDPTYYFASSWDLRHLMIINVALWTNIFGLF